MFSYKAMIVPANSTHRAQSRLIRRDREIRIFGYFSFFMHARNISERDFQTIHLKIITHKKALFMSNDLIYDLGPVSAAHVRTARARLL